MPLHVISAGLLEPQSLCSLPSVPPLFFGFSAQRRFSILASVSCSYLSSPPRSLPLPPSPPSLIAVSPLLRSDPEAKRCLQGAERWRHEKAQSCSQDLTFVILLSLLWLISRSSGGKCVYSRHGRCRHYYCSCCGYIVCLCNFVRLSVMFFFCLFFNLISNHSDFQQPGFNNINFMDSAFFFVTPHFSMEGGDRGVIEGCQQLPYNTPGLTW